MPINISTEPPRHGRGLPGALAALLALCLLCMIGPACSDPPEPPPPECTSGADCDSGVCLEQECQVPVCTDGVQNGSETDVDCGGTCAKCAAGQGCQVPGDCSTGQCDGATCQALKGLGEACEETDECEAAYQCLTAGDQKVCSQLCTDSCPGDFACFRRVCVSSSYCDDPDGDGFGVGPGCTGTVCDQCDSRATCVDQGNFNFACVCNEGYTGDGISCQDFDECASGVDDCAERASCTNTMGGYECECPDGYTGDGTECADVNECALGMDDCDELAVCNNLDGGFFCACPPGARDVNGDGTVCSGVDECVQGTDDCAPEATCVDTEEGFTCECDEGYNDANPNLPGRECLDIKECSSGKDDCAMNARCDNTVGGFTCTCPDTTNDVNGDGTVCRQEDLCDPAPSDCSQNAECRNSTTDARGYVCLCQGGYRDVTGDGSECVEIDECAEGLDNCDEQYASCSNTPGSFTCTCDDGFLDVRGNGSLCADINECIEDTDDCDPNASCSNTVGSYECSCDPTFLGDGFSCRLPGSCLELLQDQPNTSSGLYSINTGMGGDLGVFCDMSTDGGGWTFLKVKHNTQASAQTAEMFCAARGMQLFIPRNKEHLESAYQIATNSNIGPDGDPTYMRILGIYPNSSGATCLRRAFKSGVSGCNWSASDGGSFYVSERDDITEPNGDNDPRASMYYGWRSGARIEWYNDIPFPGYLSGRFMCDTADKR